jgi:hypothetical protein
LKKVPIFLSIVLAWAASAASALGQDAVNLPAKPKNPKAGRVLKLREVLRISDAQGGFYFKAPENLQAAPDGGLFVVDDGEFLRFDAAGKFAANLFRKGQGPGEFQRIENYAPIAAEVLAFQRNPLKLVRMDLGGALLGEVKPDAPVSRLLGLDGGRLVMANNSMPAVDKVQKPEGEVLDIVWTLHLMTAEGAVTATPLTFPTKWFAKRLPGALIADNLTVLLAAPLGNGLVAVAHEDAYSIKVADLEKKEVVRTLARATYRRVKYEAPPAPEAPGGARRLSVPRDYFNDIQKLVSVDGRIWVMTSTVEPGKGVLVDVLGPDGEYLDNFYLPLPKGVGPRELGRHPLTIAGKTVLTVEVREDGLTEVVKYEILD